MWWVPDVKHTLGILPEHLLLCVMFFGVDYCFVFVLFGLIVDHVFFIMPSI